uniref:hypothetical protein n=1 Tax=Celeribacter marinus TaxID=1397108 RepID=UPI003F6B594B
MDADLTSHAPSLEKLASISTLAHRATHQGHVAADLSPKFPPALRGALGVMHLPPTLDQLDLEISGFRQIGGLVSP